MDTHTDIPTPMAPSLRRHGDHDSEAWVVGTVVFVLALSLYVATMCRTVFWWDTGELAANAKVLGIAHRPGFPLYVLVGRLFGMIPFGEFFYRINFLSAFSASAALGILSATWYRIIRAAQPLATRFDLLISVGLPILAVGGTYTLWMQAVRAEVYAPSLLIVAILCAAARHFSEDARSNPRRAAQWLLLSTFVAGLGLGLHNATVASTLPAFTILMVAVGWRTRIGLKTWLTSVLLFAAGLSVYLYMPIRAAQNPPLNWGWAPIAPSPGWGGVVGSDSWTAILASAPADIMGRVWKSLILIFNQWELGLALLVIAGLGFWWVHRRRWFWLTLGIIFGNTLVTAILVSEFSDTNADIHGYLLPALAMAGFALSGGILLVASGFRSLLSRMPTVRLRPILLGISITMIAMLAVAPTLIYAPYCNLVRHQLAYDYGTESTAWLKPNAVVILAGTNFDFVLRGLQYCDGWRPDLTVLNRDLLPAAWYREWAFTIAPELASVEIPTYERGLDVQQWARDLAVAGFPVYWEFTEINMAMVPNLLPAGHLFEVSPEPVTTLSRRLIRGQEDFESQSRFYATSEHLLHDYDAQMVYVSSLYRAGLYYESRGLYDRARELFRRALSLGQEGDEAQTMRQRLPAGPWIGAIDTLSGLSTSPPLDPNDPTN